MWTRGKIDRSLDLRYSGRKLLRDLWSLLDTVSPRRQTNGPLLETHLLSVVGCIGEHGGHMKHQLVVLIGGVERVCASGVSCNTGQDSQGLRPQYKGLLY